MLKVLHVTAQKPDSTGSGIYLSGLIKGMKKLVGEQYLLCGIDENDSEDEIEKRFGGNLKVYPIKYGKNMGFDVPGMSDNMPYKSTRYRDMTEDMADKMKDNVMRALNSINKNFDPDLIVCHHLYYETSIVREFFPDKKIVAICHGTCLRQLKSNDFKKEYILKNIKKIDRIYSLHDEQKVEIMNFFGVENVDTLGSAYDNTIFFDMNSKKSRDTRLNSDTNIGINKNNKEQYLQANSIKNGITISYAGKIAFSKGLVQLIQSVDKANFKTNVKFIMIGDGSIESETTFIKRLAKSSKCDFDFVGRVNQMKLSEYLNMSDIFVLPSFYEGLPLVLLEAMACKNFIITTDIPGVKKWLGEEIYTSGIIDFVDLPVMKSVSTPDERFLGDFVDRLTKSLEKMVDRCVNIEIPDVDIDRRSWSELAKKVVNDFYEEI